MAPSYQPGDIIINSMVIKGLPITTGFISASLYESIFMPTMVAEFDLRDTDDALFSKLNLSGGEEFFISFQTPGGVTNSYKFLINKPHNVMASETYKSKTMKLICASEEAFYASGGVDSKGYIQKSYQRKLISDNVNDVLTSYLNTTKNVNIEPTKGVQNIIAQNEKAWEFIDRIRRRSVSSTDSSSSYVFFENKDGFNFVTIEKMFTGPVVKNFVFDNTTAADIMKLSDNNIFGYKLPHMFNAMDRIDKGTMSSRVSSFNFETNEYSQKTIKSPGASDPSGGKNNWNTAAFESKFGKYPGRASVLPYDNRLPISNIPDSTPNQLAYSGNLMQNMVSFRVFGDTKLKAGDRINAAIPASSSLTTGGKLDSDMAGDFIIASIRHIINPIGMHPRYTCILECLKGNPT